ncbi:hypothetical protein DJ568_09100 [Mucilaginibacter hurinus]|uniref:SGNH hydrolase-type esterase domain-containing protein n=1 Tax=Mucilaginibacter hurinus TaxID=2201324 RepID=A0A367GPC2_9SPHI|nr:SGNH/GDSL hydrolase family protein [Mucilaginibacter hurinus]RCH55327.1 hypothetical protein DJ568_09100 [Mucilaginibacter hurinus]
MTTINPDYNTNTFSAKSNLRMRFNKCFTPLLLLLAVMAITQSCSNKTMRKSPAQQQTPTVKLFKKNDRVMFLGNSITHGGRYHNYIWLYYMTRFPDLRFTILNGGVAGDIIANINNRLQEDIFSKNPNIINLSFGMNDSGYFQYAMSDPAVASDKLVFKCDSAFKLVVAQLNQHPEIQKILMSGSPYDLETKVKKDKGWAPKPATFERIVQMQATAAKANRWPFVDIYHPMDRLNKDNQKVDSNFTLSGSGDRIHPESYGHLVWAYLYLCNQGLKGVPVADFTVDASQKRATAVNNCVIKNVTGTQNMLSFDYLAKSLPFPIDEELHNGDKQPASAALRYVPLMDDLNKEMLRVTNLDGKTYELKIDGKVMASFTAEDLAKGVNMAAIKTTPQYLQAMEILKKNEERGTVERETRSYAVQVYNFARAGGIKVDNDSASWAKMREMKKTNGWIDNDLYERGSNPATQKAWQDKMDSLVNEIYASNKPVNHKIQLVKIN